MLYQYRILGYGLTVSLEAADQNDAQAIAYAGTSGNVASVKARLSEAYGAFGHRFDPEGSTPLDLHHALVTTFPEGLVEPLTETPSYDPEIPAGAVT